MEMIGFSQNQTDSTWKGVLGKPVNSSDPSSSKTTINESTADFYQHEIETATFEGSSEKYLILGSDSTSWQDQNMLPLDDFSLRCLLPCVGNERPSQGLSLSLSSTNPNSIGLQSFELRQNNQNNIIPHGLLGKGGNHQGQFHLMRNSRYLRPAWEVLNEFCSLGTYKQMMDAVPKQKHKNKQWHDEHGSSPSRNQSLHLLDFMELQKRKTKLLSMLEEVDRRYRHYRNQMKAVVSPFEAVAGAGAASVYSALACKAMSRHFRCLKDGIVSQIQATKKAMGERDPVVLGITKGETPRLRILDQALRQQRSFQQMSIMESHPWRPQRGLPERSVSVLRAWLFEHFLNPYPSDVDKHILARQTGLSRGQVSNWFINARVRLWKPMVEEMYLEEIKEQENNMASSDGLTDGNVDRQNPLPEQKPTAGQLGRVADSECLSSIVSDPDKTDPKATKTLQNHHMHPQQGFGAYGAAAAAMELDFSSYNHHTVSGVSFSGQNSANHNINGGSGVSLTLGLQHHDGGGVSLALSPASQNSFLYTRDHIEDCQPAQYSLLDGDGQHLPYRDLMGAHLLHDLAG
ncbi:hypothetical protein SLA2020_497430 [Shorea laevis]